MRDPVPIIIVPTEATKFSDADACFYCSRHVYLQLYFHRPDDITENVLSNRASYRDKWRKGYTWTCIRLQVMALLWVYEQGKQISYLLVAIRQGNNYWRADIFTLIVSDI